MIREVQEEGRRLERRRSLPTLESLQQTLDDHERRLNHCEELNDDLRQQFDDLVAPFLLCDVVPTREFFPAFRLFSVRKRACIAYQRRSRRAVNAAGKSTHAAGSVPFVRPE